MRLLNDKFVSVQKYLTRERQLEMTSFVCFHRDKESVVFRWMNGNLLRAQKMALFPFGITECLSNAGTCTIGFEFGFNTSLLF